MLPELGISNVQPMPGFVLSAQSLSILPFVFRPFFPKKTPTLNVHLRNILQLLCHRRCAEVIRSLVVMSPAETYSSARPLPSRLRRVVVSRMYVGPKVEVRKLTEYI